MRVTLRISLMVLLLAASVAGWCGPSTIYDAVSMSDISAVKVFLSRNPKLINQRQAENGRTPLHWAAFQECRTQEALNTSLEMTRFLLSHGANVNAKNKWGETPLFLTIVWAKPTLARLLISKGADVNSKNQDSFSILHLVAKTVFPYPQWDLSELLISKGGKSECH